jgi:hypothetical protein
MARLALRADPREGKSRARSYYANGGWRLRIAARASRARPTIACALSPTGAIGHAPRRKGGVGFAFLPGDGLIGIDLDR